MWLPSDLPLHPPLHLLLLQPVHLQAETWVSITTGTEPGTAHWKEMWDAEAMPASARTRPSITPRSGKSPSPWPELLWRQQLDLEGDRIDGQTDRVSSAHCAV